ncbi:hypothetical protein D3C85_1360280 [compost metagenome]
MAANDLVVPGERGLGAGVQALAAGGQQDVLDEHAQVHEAAGVEAAVEADQQADRGVEELVVAQVLLFARLQVIAGDAERFIETEAGSAAASQVGFEPVVRVVAVLGVVLPRLCAGGLEDIRAQGVFGVTG